MGNALKEKFQVFKDNIVLSSRKMNFAGNYENLKKNMEKGLLL
jgi:hypothetical protein